MKHIFFELFLHLGFLLCHVGCKLAGLNYMSSSLTDGKQRVYVETYDKQLIKNIVNEVIK